MSELVQKNTGYWLGLDTAGKTLHLVLIQLQANQPVIHIQRFVTFDRPLVAEKLHEVFSESMKASGVSLDRIQGLVVGLGPGTFTGLRVGLGFSKTFSFDRNLPMIGISSLRFRARAAARTEFLMPAATGDRYFWRGTEDQRDSPLGTDPLQFSGIEGCEAGDWGAANGDVHPEIEAREFMREVCDAVQNRQGVSESEIQARYFRESDAERKWALGLLPKVAVDE